MSERETDSDTPKPWKRVRQESQSPESPTRQPKKKTMAPTKPDTSVADGFKTLNENLNSMRNDFNSNLTTMRNDFQAQFDKLNTKIETQFVTWQKEKEELITKQAELESRVDRLERQEKRNNVVITGLKVSQQISARSAVDDLFTKQLGLTVTALDAFQIKLKSGQSKFIARMRSWDDKMAVTKANREMKNDVYIDDDLIRKDHFIQFKAREFAKLVRADGKEAKVGAGKVFVNGVVHVWDENGQSFLSRKN